MIDFVGVGAFFLAWWALSLIIIGLVLTVLLGCGMIVGLSKWVWRLAVPKGRIRD